MLARMFVSVRSEEKLENPLERLPRKPYLSSQLFQPGSESENRQMDALLRRFYCDRRVGNVDIEERFLVALQDEQYRVTLLWGDCGIGKTWFLHHLMRIRLPAERKTLRQRLKGGIVDVLWNPLPTRKLSRELSIHYQIGRILDKYMADEGGIWRECLQPKIDAVIRERYPKYRARTPQFEEAGDAYYGYLTNFEELPQFNLVRFEWLKDKGVPLFIIVDKARSSCRRRNVGDLQACRWPSAVPKCAGSVLDQNDH